MPNDDLRGRQHALEYRPPLQRDGRPAHGAHYGRGRVLRLRSRGPGVAVPVRNPLGRIPTRIDGFSVGDRAQLSGAQTFDVLRITPLDIPEGQVVTIIVS